MIQFSYQLYNYEKWLDHFSKALGVEKENNNLVYLPSALGTGYAYAKNISKDISFVVLNFQIRKSLHMIREHSDSASYSIFFNQLEINNEVEISMDRDIINYPSGNRASIFISNSADPVSVKYGPGTTIKRIGILFSKKIASQHLSYTLIELLETHVKRKIRNLNNLPLSTNQRMLLNELLNVSTSTPLSPLGNYIRILQLTESVLQSISSSPSKQQKQMKPEDLRKIQLIEAEITQPQLTDFPSIASLSKKATMSPSKLKALFKSVYGHTLYAYYNKNRMMRARDMMNLRYSIKEIGYEVGYTNLSQFTAAFKKEFGMTPSQYLRTAKGV